GPSPSQSSSHRRISGRSWVPQYKPTRSSPRRRHLAETSEPPELHMPGKRAPGCRVLSFLACSSAERWVTSLLATEKPSSRRGPSAEIRVTIGHRGNRQKQEKRFLSVLCGYISQISAIL